MKCAGLLLALAGMLSAAQQKPAPKFELRWADLPELITGYQVSLALPGGQKVRGKVLAVEPEALILWAGKDRRSIPRESITELRLSKTRGYTWRVLGTVLGTVAGLLPGIAVAFANPPAGVAIIAAGGGLGFWGGHGSDHKSMVVTVVPD